MESLPASIEQLRSALLFKVCCVFLLRCVSCTLRTPLSEPFDQAQSVPVCCYPGQTSLSENIFIAGETLVKRSKGSKLATMPPYNSIAV
jgi:hypothetical protein